MRSGRKRTIPVKKIVENWRKLEMTTAEKEKRVPMIMNLPTADEIVRKVQEENKTDPQELIYLKMALELGKGIQRIFLLLRANEEETASSKDTQKMTAMLAELVAKMHWLQKVRR